jgi:hypothetical protein
LRDFGAADCRGEATACRAEGSADGGAPATTMLRLPSPAAALPNTSTNTASNNPMSGAGGRLVMSGRADQTLLRPPRRRTSNDLDKNQVSLNYVVITIRAQTAAKVSIQQDH